MTEWRGCVGDRLSQKIYNPLLDDTLDTYVLPFDDESLSELAAADVLLEGLTNLTSERNQLTGP